MINGPCSDVDEAWALMFMSGAGAARDPSVMSLLSRCGAAAEAAKYTLTLERI